MQERAGTRWWRPDAYTATAVVLFLVTAVCEWRDYIRKHEAIYLLGSRRIADPGFLAHDFTWGNLPPTTFVFDHLLAPFWASLGEPGIVLAGRLIIWALLAWSLAALAREMRLPPWSLVAGFALWLVWDQTIAACGRPLEGLQPKAFAYPLAFFSLAFVLRGWMLRAGIAAGVAIAFHIIIGGWACVALVTSMLLNRGHYSLRDVTRVVVAAAIFALPLVVVIVAFHSGGVSAGQRHLMDQIYVTFSQPHCVDPTYFLTPAVVQRALIVFPVSVLLVLAWPEARPARLVAGFLLTLVVLFAAGLLAGYFHWYGFLKLYPFQLANALPALLLFVMSLAFFGRWPQRTLARGTVWALGLLASIALAIDGQVIERASQVPESFADSLDWQGPSRYSSAILDEPLALYAWISANTSRDSVFVTPYLPEFWTYAGRAQVASFRHPPHDHHLIEWKRRLEAMNGSRAFVQRGFDIQDEFNIHEAQLTKEQLALLARTYGATHYLAIDRGGDTGLPLLYSSGGYEVYDLREFAR